MAYSFMTAISDGTLRVMPITFPYMKLEDINVRQNVTLLKVGKDYDINNNVITFRYNIPKGDRIAVDRMSQKGSLRVNFLEGATFSRENMDDALTQLLYLTQEAIEGSVDRVSPTGVLDLNGNRIINLGDPIDLQDAVPLHLVVDAEKSVYASEAMCKKYRDETLGYKDAAFTSADRAYASERNAKASEESALSSKDAAKTSETNAATSATAAKNSETSASDSKNAAKGYADATQDIFDKLIPELQANGSVPVGTIAMVAHNSATPPVGWLFCGTTFDKTTYPALARLFPDGRIPDFTNRFPRGAGATAVGTHGAESIPSHTHGVSVSGNVSTLAQASYNTTSSGAYNSTLSTSSTATSSSGSHTHGIARPSSGSKSINTVTTERKDYSNLTWTQGYVETTGAHTHTIPAHSHSVSIPNHSHEWTLPSHNHSFSWSGNTSAYGSGSSVLPLNIGVKFIIKAYEGVNEKDEALVVVGRYDARVTALEDKIAALESQVAALLGMQKNILPYDPEI